MKMRFYVLPPGGESSPLRRRAAGHQGQVKTGQTGIWLNMCEGLNLLWQMESVSLFFPLYTYWTYVINDALLALSKH